MIDIFIGLYNFTLYYNKSNKKRHLIQLETRATSSYSPYEYATIRPSPKLDRNIVVSPKICHKTLTIL